MTEQNFVDFAGTLSDFEARNNLEKLFWRTSNKD